MGILRRLTGGGAETVARAARPEELAASRGRPTLEGLDWLGRKPSTHAPLLYRALLRAGEFFLYRVCAIQVVVSGRENLPDGGYLAAAALHRGWIDPLVVLRVLPLQPRVWFLGSAASAFDRRWKERLLHRVGGLLPVWRGGGIGVHVTAARAVAAEGAVLCLFIEGGIVGPPDRVWPGVRSGAGLLALRTDVPIVPIALLGTDELYRGRRVAARILPPVTVNELLGDDMTLPAPNTRDEQRAARAIVHAIAARIDAALPDLAEATANDPRRRRWRWLDRLFR